MIFTCLLKKFVSMFKLNLIERGIIKVKFLKREMGFTLIELMAVISIIALLASMAIASYRQAIGKAKIATTIADIKNISKQIVLYELQNDKLPEELEDLIPDYIKKIPSDPWGSEYKYLNLEGDLEKAEKGKRRKDGPIVPINTRYDLYSIGPDQKTTPTIRSQAGKDDIIYANDGDFIGLAEDY